MKTRVSIIFKGNPTAYTCEPSRKDRYGYWDLGNDLTLSVTNGQVYRRSGNVVCGVNITDQVFAINIFMDNSQPT